MQDVNKDVKEAFCENFGEIECRGADIFGVGATTDIPTFLLNLTPTHPATPACQSPTPL